MVAVLAVPNPKQLQASTSVGGLPRSQSLNSVASLVTATVEDESSLGRPSRKSSLGGEDEWIVQDHSIFAGQDNAPVFVDKKTLSSGQSDPEDVQPNATLDSSSQSSTPVRRIFLYNKPQKQTRKQRRAVVVHSGHVSRNKVGPWCVGVVFSMSPQTLLSTLDRT